MGNLYLNCLKKYPVSLILVKDMFLNQIFTGPNLAKIISNVLSNSLTLRFCLKFTPKENEGDLHDLWDTMQDFLFIN